VLERRVSTTRIGRYTLHHAVASGGMATVHLGRMESSGGVQRTVAIKRVHPQFAADPEFVAMFFDEARLCFRIQHPHVVPTFDVVAEGGELLLVMDYVHGDSLASLVHQARLRGERVPPDIASAVLCDVLAGLHAAHELRGEDGKPLGLVHRDVSPQNILVGVDGASRVLDFGVARAAGGQHATDQGKVKGKIAYMAPEQLASGPIDRRADVFSAAIVLWELLAGARLFDQEGPGAVAIAVLSREIRSPRERNVAVDVAVECVVMKGLRRHVDERYASAEAMAIDLERALPPASARAVGEWVQRVASARLAARAEALAEVERGTASAEAPELEGMAASGVDVLPSEVSRGAPALAAPETMATLRSSSVPGERPGGGAGSRRGFWVAGAAAALLAAGATALLVGTGAPHPRADVAVSAAPAEVASSVAPPPSASAPPLVSATAAASASGGPSPPATTTAPRPSPTDRPRNAAPRSSRPATPPDCANPFVVDAKGIRVPRPECF
jgi:serine/threonine-protein kinase